MAGTAELLHQLKRITTSLQRISECLICLESVNVPFVLCTRGHMMCCACIKSLRVCPVCQADFSIENPVCVKNFLECIPRFCRNSSEGCQAIVECGSDHETVCGTKVESCRCWGCDSAVPVFQMVKHYESEHPERLIIKQEQLKFIWPNFSNFKVERQDDVPVYLNNTFFWLVLRNDGEGNQLKISFQAVPSSKYVDECFIKLENNNRSHMYTLKSVIKKESATDNDDCLIVEDDDCVVVEDDDCIIVSDDKEKERVSSEEQQYTRIPHVDLQQFLNEDVDLEFNLTFFQKDSKPKIWRHFYSLSGGKQSSH